MKTRTIKELLQIMLANQTLFHVGLCYWAELLWENDVITFEEYRILLEYISSNRPHKYSSIEAYKWRNSSYFWESGNITPRIKWIKKHIKKHES